MGGGRGLLGREPLGPGGGCPREGPLCPSPSRADRRGRPPAAPPRPSPSGGRALPARSCPLPRRACLCSRNSAPGSRRLRRLQAWCGPAAALSGRPGPSRAPLDPVLRSSCKPGSCYTRDGPPAARRPPTAGAWPDSQAGIRVPRDLRCRCRAPTVHRIAPADALQPSGIWTHHHPPGGGVPEPLTAPRDDDCNSSPPPRRGRPAFHRQRGPLPPYSQRHLLLPLPLLLLLLPGGCQVPGVPGSHVESLIVSCGPVSFAQNPVLF